ncbi:MAG: NAD(P)-dependent oxidoreductase [Acidobacteria bacterium]|nr:NAD(P)-dependent oxidoreductase [Acidobacteriota bacterium]MBI3428025.1 NAD(P)-dependent oxidoreductase [Acidobacteriota bacterium]
METEAQLEDALSAPTPNEIAVLGRLSGDIILLGAGGKIGPSLARRVKRAVEAAGLYKRVIAVSRFNDAAVRAELERVGIETLVCDLLRRDEVDQLPEAENVFYLAGRKFGSTERSDLTWASNTLAPALVAQRHRHARIVVYSTGNVYPLVNIKRGGAVETDAPAPVGEYAQSCLGRERLFEFFAREDGTRCLLLRLNYALDLRYGVLVDIARKVHTGQPIDLTMGNFNVIWQGDANAYAVRALELCEAPPRILNVTGPETVSVRHTAEFFATRFNRPAIFAGAEGEVALLNNATFCHRLFGYPEVTLGELLELVAHWVERGGVSLNKPTKFEVTDGSF